MNDIGVVIKASNIFLSDGKEISNIAINDEIKFVHKNKIESGTVIGKGDLEHCQNIIDILTRCKSAKSRKNECLDVSL